MATDPPSNPIQQTLIHILERAAMKGLRDFLIIGGNAVIAHSVPRFTQDIDLVIPEREIGSWRTLLEQENFEMIPQPRHSCNSSIATA